MAVRHLEGLVMASALYFFICFFVSLLPTDAVTTNARKTFDWQILSASNFSSQIRLHAHAVVFVTDPWSGETRSLQRDLSHELANKQDELGSLKLMVVYRNQNKELADSLAATEGIAVLCYIHGVSYKYQGRLRTRDILYSMGYLMSLVADELPFEKIKDSEDLDKFVASTDKAVLLVDSCDWTFKLLAQHRYNSTAEGTSVDGYDFARDSSVEVNQAIESRGLENKEATGSEKLKCDAEHGFGVAPWILDFATDNGSSSFVDHGGKILSVGSSCSTEEFQKFSSFFSKFIFVARNSFLPPQRQRFGLVSQKSLLSSLAHEDFGTWSLIIYNTACPNSSKILKDEKQIQAALEMPNFSITELADGLDGSPALPLYKPSVILFVDRLADSSDTRKMSIEALDAFKQLAVLCNASCQTRAYDARWAKKSSTKTYHRSSTVSQYSRTQLLTAPSDNLKEKMSIMVIKDGKRVTLDNVGPGSIGHSLQEILTHMLGENKPKRLSSVAKEVGFQLLSDDLDITVTDGPPNQTAELSEELLMEEREAVKEKDHGSSVSDQQSNVKISEPSNTENKESAAVSADPEFIIPDEVDKFSDEPVISIKKDVKVGFFSVSDNHERPDATNNDPSKESVIMNPDSKFSSSDTCSEVNTVLEASDVPPPGLTYENEEEEEEEVVEEQDEFQGSYFFSDGNYQLLTSLIGESKVPRIVILDPVAQLHYVLPESICLSHILIEDAIDRFFNGTLSSPYQRSSGPFSVSKKEFPVPPFVNLDFHEKYSIPSVTTNTFTGLVLGSKRFNPRNASNPWNSDVLVLFSNSWCGFCQRMELVVREVYRSLKGYYMKQEKRGSKSDDKLKGINMSKFPVIYQIDCTLNDCSLLLKRFNQREVYPSLLLFPAKRKNAAVLYEGGGVAVNDIIKFIATHGSNSFLQKDDVREEAEEFKEDYHEVILKEDRVVREQQKTVRLYWNRPLISKPPPLRGEDVVGSSTTTTTKLSVGLFLVATEMVGNSSPFSNGKILIVSADESSGVVVGVMINKHMKWESVPELNVSDEVKQAPLSFGGPVVQGESPLVCLSKRSDDELLLPEVLPGIHYLDQFATSEVIRGRGEESCSFWFFLGYSGWSWDQLVDEISQGVWSLVDNDEGGLEWPAIG